MRRGRISYSPTEMKWLESNRMMVISDYHRAFQAEFGRPDILQVHLHGLRKRLGWKVGRDPGRYKGRRLKYTGAEIAWLRDNSTMEINAWCAAFREAFGHEDATPAKLHSLRKREGWKTGRTGQFEKGAAPWTKGKKLPFNANSAATQFKKGLTPHNRRGPGHESVDEDGYIWIVTDQRNPWTGASTWRVHKHRWLWEQANGPVPEGMVLKCLGEKSNSDPSNWELVPIGLLPRLNGKSNRAYDRAPAELKPTIMAVAKLEHAVAARRKSKSERTPT
ncbi:HNH endonuclease signature motif containing protein [Mesorhizobium sp.]|uniref:HNH endonuclease signature motif containing protein n=1 Tax=Mesorhizobium sp. TaxID=1871066 RepID=UPI002579482B|nr:HNH endonuclease signature motif containing protein [Mesorhizobium sp.]